MDQDEEATAPLVGFFDHLEQADLVASEDSLIAIKALSKVLQPHKTLPTDLSLATQNIQHLSASDVPTDGGLSAVFMGIAAGKTFVKQAKQIADQAGKEYAFLEQSTEQFKPLKDLAAASKAGEELPLDCPSVICAGFDAVSIVLESKACEASKAFLASATPVMYEVVQAFCRSVLKNHFIPWTAEAEQVLQGNADCSKLASPAKLDIKELEAVSAHKCLKKAQNLLLDLGCTRSFHNLLHRMYGVIQANGATDARTIVSFVRDVEEFLDTRASLLARVDESAPDTMRSILQCLSTRCTATMQQTARGCMKALAEHMAKASISISASIPYAVTVPINKIINSQ